MQLHARRVQSESEMTQAMHALYARDARARALQAEFSEQRMSEVQMANFAEPRFKMHPWASPYFHRSNCQRG